MNLNLSKNFEILAAVFLFMLTVYNDSYNYYYYVWAFLKCKFVAADISDRFFY
jgi:hypothetical protein